MFKLTREATTVQDTAPNQHQWPVKFTAKYLSNNAPAYIFVMRATPEAGLFLDNFSCVASAIQMSDLPVGEPGEGSPYYRVAEITQLCRSAAAAEEFNEKVVFAVTDLATNLHAADHLAIEEETTILPLQL